MTEIMQPPVNCLTAEEFLNEILRVGKNGNNLPWLFRGQGKDWPLVPSLFRTDAKDALRSLTNRNIDNDDKLSAHHQLLLSEVDIFYDFFEIADKRGLVIPDDSRQLRSYLEKIRGITLISGEFLENGVGFLAQQEMCWSLLGLGQHYGIPTRFLDWTRRSLVAIFFAAEGGIKVLDKYPGANMVVWALYYPTLGFKTSEVQENYSLRVIAVPSATNPNLAAQQGVFTLVHPRHTEEAFGNYRPLDEIFLNPNGKSFRRDAEGIKLRKYIVPVSEAKELLRLLERFDITPSVIYPGYQSIVNDMKNRTMWGKK